MIAIALMKMSKQKSEAIPLPIPLCSNQLDNLMNSIENTAANVKGMRNGAAKYNPAKARKKNKRT